MKKLVFALSTLALVAPLTAANAAPDKPIHAAQPSSGEGCIVRASETDGYQFDATCQAHQVVKRDKSGALRSFFYQDKGTLQPGQTAPGSAVRISLDGQSVGGLPCTGSEVITPSGEYSSNLKCSD